MIPSFEPIHISTVCLAAMPDGNNLDNMIGIIDGIDDAIVTNTNTPTILRTNKFATA